MQTHSYVRMPDNRLCALLLLSCLAIVVWQPARSQEPIPAASKRPGTPIPADRFAQDLETLAKRLDVAIVAEGEPFPQRGGIRFPSLNSSLLPEQAVKEVADCFDYDVVRHDNVYLLTKRYTQPGDLPDVTLEECRNGLRQAMGAFPIGRFASNAGKSPEEALIQVFTDPTEAGPTAAQWERMTQGEARLSEMTSLVQYSVWLASSRFYYQAFQDRIVATAVEMEKATPADPLFQWKPVGKATAFGYETDTVDLVPLSDPERIVLSRAETPLPRPAARLRTDAALPSDDPTAPALLSEQAKRFIDEAGTSASVSTLGAAVVALNKRTPGTDNYDVDSVYSSKHLIIAGAERVSAETLMQALADVYGLRVRHDGEKRILTAPEPFYPLVVTDIKRALTSAIPAPIHRAFCLHAASVAHPHGGLSPSPADYERQGIAIHNTLLQIFRYLAEPQIPYDSDTTRALSRLGERAGHVFTLSQMARAYADLCGAADCPLPPYLVDFDTFARRVTLKGRRALVNGSMCLQLFLTYTDPKTRTTSGPYELVNNFPGRSNYPARPTAAPNDVAH